MANSRVKYAVRTWFDKLQWTKILNVHVDIRK